MASNLWFMKLFKTGFLGVDYFFCLSGYILTYIYFDSDIKYFVFIKKRAKRILPLFYFSFFVYVSLLSFKNIIIDNIDLNFIDIANTLLLLNSNPLLGNSEGVNGISWSVSSELFIYVLFGCILFIDNILRFRILLLLWFFFTVWYSNLNYAFPQGDFGFVRCGYLFFFGSISFKLQEKVEIYKKYVSLLFVSSLFLVVSYSYYFSFLGYNLFYDHLIALIATPLLSISCIYLVQFYSIPFLNKYSLKKLGQYSYSIYLNHATILVFFLGLIRYFNLVNFKSSSILQFSTLCLVFVLLLVYSKITYKFVENKFTRLFDR